MSIPRYQLSKRAGGRASHSGAGTHWCVPSRTRAVTGRYRPIDIDRSPEHLCPESTQLRFRPVRPAQSAWHEMPGDASPGCRRPARAVSATPRRVMGGTRGVWRGGAIVDLWLAQVPVGCRGIRSGVDGAYEPRHVDRMQPNAALPGRSQERALQAERDVRVGFPGLHPGLVELALQAVIAGVRCVDRKSRSGNGDSGCRTDLSRAVRPGVGRVRRWQRVDAPLPGD
jgi:hypothetical protein